MPDSRHCAIVCAVTRTRWKQSDILAHLVIGSEGPLAFVAEAVFRTVNIARHASTGRDYQHVLELLEQATREPFSASDAPAPIDPR